MVRSFLRLLPYVARTVWRARTRSLLTVLGTALALGLFAFVRSLEAGVERLRRASDRPVLVVFQSSRFCALTSQLPLRYARDIERMDGVTAVLPTLLHINSCRTNLDLVTLHGVAADEVERFHRMKAVAGDTESWKRRTDGALLGRRLAERRGVSVGERVRLTNVDVEVGGIIESPGGLLDNLAFVHLDQLALARQRQGQATQFLVRLEEGTNATEIARRIDEHFAGDEQPTDTKTMQAFVAGAVSEVAELVQFGRLLGYLAVLVVVLVLGNTVWISAHTRMSEMGVLQTVGATRGLVSALVVTEGVVLALLGGLLGVGAVSLFLHLRPTTLGVEGYGIDLLPNLSLVLVSLAVSVGVGILASIGPALEALGRPLAVLVKPA